MDLYYYICIRKQNNTIMFSEKDLIFIGAILLKTVDPDYYSMDEAVEDSKKMYNKVFKEDEEEDEEE